MEGGERKLFFCLREVSEDYTLRLINHLGANKSTGLDGIPARFIKEGALILKGPITHIINLSIQTNEVPTSHN